MKRNSHTTKVLGLLVNFMAYLLGTKCAGVHPPAGRGYSGLQPPPRFLRRLLRRRRVFLRLFLRLFLRRERLLPPTGSAIGISFELLIVLKKTFPSSALKNSALFPDCFFAKAAACFCTSAVVRCFFSSTNFFLYFAANFRFASFLILSLSFHSFF